MDAGGGTGGFAVPLAEAGHQVTVVDPSPDSLAALQRRAAERSLDVAAVQGDLADLADLVAPGSADLVLCHSVLEVVDDPAAALASPAARAPTAAVGCRCSSPTAMPPSWPAPWPAGRTRPRTPSPTRPAAGARPTAPPGAGPPRPIAAAVTAAGLQVEQVHGVRTVSDLVPSAVLDTEPGAAAALLALERTLSDRPPFRDLATQLHVLARKP